MWELTEFVIPKVKDKWEHLAYRMRYKVGEVQAFKIDSQDVKDCCMKLFSDWITTSHGPMPKSYQTLLHNIKKINDLTTASEEIERDLIKGEDKQIT